MFVIRVDFRLTDIIGRLKVSDDVCQKSGCLTGLHVSCCGIDRTIRSAKQDVLGKVVLCRYISMFYGIYGCER